MFRLSDGLSAFAGLKGLFRGWPPNVIFVMPEKALKLTLNEFFRESFGERRGAPPLALHKEMVCECGHHTVEWSLKGLFDPVVGWRISWILSDCCYQSYGIAEDSRSYL